MSFGAFMSIFRSSDNRFVYHCFQSDVIKKQIQEHLGATINQITRRSLSSFQIPYPTAEERSAIAAALSDTDGLIRALGMLITKKRTIKQAAMEQLLTGKSRLPSFRGRWSTTRLGNLGNFSKGYGIRRDDTSREGFPCIRYGEIYTKYENFVSDLTARIPLDVARSASPIKTGDLLFAGSGETADEIGRCVAYLGEEQAYAGGDIIVLTPVGQNSLYLGYLLNHSTVAVQKARVAQGDAVVHISAANLARVQFFLPPVEEQAAISGVLFGMDADIIALKRRRDKIRAIKQGMMQQLLTGRVRLVKPKEATERSAVAARAARKHNWQFNEAVVIAVLARKFGNDRYPLGRMRYTKLSYLLHRHEEGRAEGYLKKAAGPYNPRTRYGGPEKIALEKRYVRQHKSGRYEGLIADDHVEEAEQYFDKWYGREALQWIEQFRYRKNDELELLATVDMAAEELRAAGSEVSVESVKGVILGDREWRAKINRPTFSDVNISRAIESCQTLFAVRRERDTA